jgi:hypothetical protein
VASAILVELNIRLTVLVVETARLERRGVNDNESGILRSKSRLANVDYLSYEVRYPVLLDKQEPLTKLIISSAHFKFAHTIGRVVARQKYARVM